MWHEVNSQPRDLSTQFSSTRFVLSKDSGDTQADLHIHSSEILYVQEVVNISLASAAYELKACDTQRARAHKGETQVRKHAKQYTGIK